MLRIALAPGYLLGATPYLETTLILFLHLLAAMATMGGAIGLLALHARAGAARSVAELRTLDRLLTTFGQRVLQPAAGITGIIGLLLALRFQGRGLFEIDRQGWLMIALVLWIVLQVVTGLTLRAMRTAIGAPVSEDDLMVAVARLRSNSLVALLWLTLILIVGIVYLMVFRPFARA